MVMFWVLLLAISILLYVLLDGADLGVGMLFGLARGEAKRRLMLRAVAPIWDGNETWLVVTGVILWGAFPVVYATLLSAFYLPLFLMLAGLILRGVAFEFRNKTERMRWIWDLSFAGGSLVASFMQGTTVGALVEGLQVTNGQYSGGDFGWLTPFAALCGIGLCLGYALLGACWLVKKCDAEVRDRAHRQIRVLAVCVLVFLVVVFATRWPSISQSCIAGLIGRISSHSRRLARAPQSCSRSVSSATTTIGRSTWSQPSSCRHSALSRCPSGPTSSRLSSPSTKRPRRSPVSCSCSGEAWSSFR